jgi:predicted lipoprotein with Yx(FWY)xxD motif
MTLMAAVALLAACAPAGGGTSADAGDGLQTIGIAVAETDAGPSLVGPDGKTLYIFTQDTDGTSTCTGDCAAAWPPLTVEAGAEIEGGDGVIGELGIIERDDGTSQVTYEGMPLYFFAQDAEPGDATGEGVNNVWFIASPEGRSGGAPSESAEPSGGDDDDEAEPTQSYDYDY